MNFFIKFKFNKNILSLILTSFFSMVIFFSSENTSSNKIKSIVIDSYSILSTPKTWYNNMLLVKQENELLSLKNAQLSLYNAKLLNYKIENETLRQMLEFKNEAFKYLSLAPAKIVNSNISPSIESVLINIGSEDGITQNLSVIDHNGFLIGKIIDVGKNNSKVQLISDNNYSVSIKVGQNISIGQFKPTYGKYGILEGIIKTSEILVNDIVYTSGISEIYPSDLPVAKIINNEKKKNKLFQDVAVEILTDINHLYYVFVIQ